MNANQNERWWYDEDYIPLIMHYAKISYKQAIKVIEARTMYEKFIGIIPDDVEVIDKTYYTRKTKKFHKSLNGRKILKELEDALK